MFQEKGLVDPRTYEIVRFLTNDKRKVSLPMLSQYLTDFSQVKF